MSLNFEICDSRLSAESESETSQPVSRVSAPKLAPVAMKRRRARSGISLVASRTSRFLSTPGMIRDRRRFIMAISSASDDHGAQTLRHQKRQRDVNHQEGADQRHHGEVHIAREIVAAEQGRKILQLHRL